MYLLDANVFIGSKNVYYGFDIFPDLLPFGICECLFTAHRINQFFKMGLLDDIPVASKPPDEKEETDEAVF